MSVAQQQGWILLFMMFGFAGCAGFSENADAGAEPSISAPLPDSWTMVQARAQRAVENAKADQYFAGRAQVRLAEAATESDLDGMRAAIAAGADVNKEGRDGITPLFWSLIKREFSAFQFLLEHRADPNKMTVDERASDGGYSSALAMAAALPDSRYLQAALEHGGDPNLSMNKPRRSPPSIALTARPYRRISKT